MENTNGSRKQLFDALPCNLKNRRREESPQCTLNRWLSYLKQERDRLQENLYIQVEELEDYMFNYETLDLIGLIKIEKNLSQRQKLEEVERFLAMSKENKTASPQDDAWNVCPNTNAFFHKIDNLIIHLKNKLEG